MRKNISYKSRADLYETAPERTPSFFGNPSMETKKYVRRQREMKPAQGGGLMTMCRSHWAGSLPGRIQNSDRLYVLVYFVVENKFPKHIYL